MKPARNKRNAMILEPMRREEFHARGLADIRRMPHYVALVRHRQYLRGSHLAVLSAHDLASLRRTLGAQGRLWGAVRILRTYQPTAAALADRPLSLADVQAGRTVRGA